MLTPRERVNEGLSVHFDRQMFLQMDQKAQAEFLRTSVQGSMMTPNEARKRQNNNTVPEGDALLAQLAMTKLEHVVDNNPFEATPSAGTQTSPNNNEANSRLVDALFPDKVLEVVKEWYAGLNGNGKV